MATDRKNWDEQFAVVVHEMAHLLGFDQNLFEYYKDDAGTPHAAVTDTKTVNGENRRRLILPNVVA